MITKSSPVNSTWPRCRSPWQRMRDTSILRPTTRRRRSSSVRSPAGISAAASSRRLRAAASPAAGAASRTVRTSRTCDHWKIDCWCWAVNGSGAKAGSPCAAGQHQVHLGGALAQLAGQARSSARTSSCRPAAGRAGPPRPGWRAGRGGGLARRCGQHPIEEQLDLVQGQVPGVALVGHELLGQGHQRRRAARLLVAERAQHARGQPAVACGATGTGPSPARGLMPARPAGTTSPPPCSPTNSTVLLCSISGARTAGRGSLASSSPTASVPRWPVQVPTSRPVLAARAAGARPSPPGATRPPRRWRRRRTACPAPSPASAAVGSAGSRPGRSPRWGCAARAARPPRPGRTPAGWSRPRARPRRTPPPAAPAPARRPRVPSGTRSTMRASLTVRALLRNQRRTDGVADSRAAASSRLGLGRQQLAPGRRAPPAAAGPSRSAAELGDRPAPAGTRRRCAATASAGRAACRWSGSARC